MAISGAEIGNIIIVLGVFILFVNLLGYLFHRLKQPKLVGEILAGILLGPWVLGKLAPSVSSFLYGDKALVALDFIYWIGLIFLMFISGSETRRLLGKENRKATAWLLGLGTPLPFFIVFFLGLAGLLPLDSLMGTAGQRTSVLLVLSIAVAVTSIPVISRIFYDLKILHTRFASLILGNSVIEDIVLWGVLAIATALAGTATLAQQHIVSDITSHVGITIIFMLVALFMMPSLLRKLHKSRWNFLIKESPTSYVILILLTYVGIASLFKINLVFPAFLAGYGIVGGFKATERDKFIISLDTISKFAISFFIPIYFAIVGYKLVFGQEFSLLMLIVFLVGSSLLSVIAIGLSSWLAGFRKLEIINLVVTLNARGGPGIVLASVAYEVGIINPAFYTTLVLTAVLTSQLAGAWLRYVLKRGWPLLYEPKESKKEVKEDIINISEGI